ncbi:GNAT family N-acetyltransferase [Candidatus Bipolaricaulota bacterium]|nr:GNAT family N-acetyltransferase [Candidatus Bipolaricaulota bacterium]
MRKYKLLDWDSNVFKFSVAAILPLSLSQESLGGILTDLRSSGVCLVYWSPMAEDRESCKAAEALGGFNTGVKRTYLAELSCMALEFKAQSANVVVWDSNANGHELIKLTQARAIHSRFFKDPKIREKHYEAVLKKWIDDSIENRTIFVTKDGNTTAGFISLNEKDGIGNIDFIVIDEAHSGKGLGRELLFHAHGWFASKGYKFVQAITQKENTIACKMYEKYGYYIKEQRAFYHFWL